MTAVAPNSVSNIVERHQILLSDQDIAVTARRLWPGFWWSCVVQLVVLLEKMQRCLKLEEP